MSRSNNSRRGIRERHDRTWLRSQHDQHERAALRDSRRLEDLPQALGGDCQACGWITGRDVCPMCGEQVAA